MTRWQIIKVLLIVAYRVLVKRDYLGLLRDLLPKEDTPATAPMKHHPSAMGFVPELRKMVRGGGAHLLVVLVLAGVAMAAGQITVTGFPPAPVTLRGGVGVDIVGGEIRATGVAVPISIQPYSNISTAVRGNLAPFSLVNTFKTYTSVGRVTESQLAAELALKSPVFANYTTLARFGAGPTYNGAPIGSGGVAGVQTFNARSGNVLPTSGDYSIGQIAGAATVATTGSYNDLSNKPTLSTVAATGSYTDLLNKPTLSTVAATGSYNDLLNKPATYTLPTATTTVLGGVKVDGTSVVIDGAGVISSTVSAGVASVDGSTGAVNLSGTYANKTTFQNYTSVDRLTVATFNNYTTNDRLTRSELSSATNSTDTTTAANSAAVKAAYDLAAGKAPLVAPNFTTSIQTPAIGINHAPTTTGPLVNLYSSQKTQGAYHYHYQNADPGIADGATFFPWHLETSTAATEQTASTLLSGGLTSTLNFGIGGAGAVGTGHAASFSTVVYGNGHIANEHTPLFSALRYDIGTGFTQSVGPSGRAWLTDFNLHGPVAVQPNLLTGINMFANNYYNGSPVSGPSGAIWIATEKGKGGGTGGGPHVSANTYPMDVGLGIVGTSNAGSTANGFNKGIQIGGSGSGWEVPSSKIGTGISFEGSQGIGADFSAAAFSNNSTAIKLSPTQKISNGSNAYTLAQLAAGTGDVYGPAASISDAIALFNGAGGKTIKDSAKTIVTSLGSTDATLPTSKAVKDVTDLKASTASPSLTGTLLHTGSAGVAGAGTVSITQNASILTFSETVTLADGDIIYLTSTASYVTVPLGGTSTIFTIGSPYGAATATNTTYSIYKNIMTVADSAGNPVLNLKAGTNTVNIGHDGRIVPYRASLSIAGPTSALFKAVNTSTSSAAQGAGLQVFQDDGAATDSGHRLGFLIFGGASDTNHTLLNTASVEAYAGSTFSASNGESYLSLRTTSAGATSRAEAVRVHSSKGVSVGSILDPGEGSIYADNYIISGHEDQTTSFTVSKDSSKITLAAATAVVTLPASLSAGHVAVTVAVAGAAASGVSFAAGSGGSVSWGDAGAPTFTNSKTADVVCHSQNTAATTTAAWRCVKGGNY